MHRMSASCKVRAGSQATRPLKPDSVRVGQGGNGSIGINLQIAIAVHSPFRPLELSRFLLIDSLVSLAFLRETIHHPPSLRFLSAVSDGVAPLLLGLTTNSLAPFSRPLHDAILASRLSCPGPVLRASDRDCSCPHNTRKTRPHCFALPSIGATPGRHQLCLLPTQPGRQTNKKRSGEAEANGEHHAAWANQGFPGHHQKPSSSAMAPKTTFSASVLGS